MPAPSPAWSCSAHRVHCERPRCDSGVLGDLADGLLVFFSLGDDNSTYVFVYDARTTADASHVPSRPPKVCSVKDAQDFAQMMQDLIALATHRAVGVIWLRLKLAERSVGLPSARKIQDVNVIYSPSKVGVHDMKAVQPDRVLFTCEDLPFEKIIPRWCEVRERLRVPLSMILELRYWPNRRIEENLLTAVCAAEVLHRGLGIKYVPEKDQGRIKGSLRNAPTLCERLRALAARLDQKAMSLLVPDVDRWAQRTTQARNALTHEARALKHSCEELITIEEVTTAVVILNLLSEVGLPAERQRAIVQEHPQLRKTARQAKIYYMGCPEPA